MPPEIHEAAGRPHAAHALIRASASLVVGAVLLLVLSTQILGVLLSALIAHAIYRRLLRALERRLPARTAAPGAVLVTVAVLAALVLLAWHAVTLLSAPKIGIPGLMDLLADVLERARASLPPWAAERIPSSADDFVVMAATGACPRVGSGALGTCRPAQCGARAARAGHRPARRIRTQAATCFRLGSRLRAVDGKPEVCVRAVVSAQLRIAVVNAVLTAAYLMVLLPLAGIHLPLARTLVVLTLLLGLVPILGNLVSNAAIVLASMMAGVGVAVASVVFLLVIHKLEYFQNAHFVGRSTKVPAFCLITAIVAMEAGFGVAGVLAAPIYCAWLFRELEDCGVLRAEVPR